MKLLNCLSCHDIVKLPPNGNIRSCMCGKSSGRYVNDTEVLIRGEGRSLSISGMSYKRSLRRQTDNYTWWVSNRGLSDEDLH